ncbi:unnamed protein product [Colias eurytheme]|nr:unnamed protein product [Colias eurytheme]
MTRKASLVVITNLLIQLCVLSLELIPNYQVRIPGYTFPGLVTPLSAHGQNGPKLCFSNNMWNSCENNYHTLPVAKHKLNVGFQNSRRSFESPIKNRIKSTEEKMHQRVANDVNGFLGHPLKTGNENINRLLQEKHVNKGLYSELRSKNVTPTLTPYDIMFNNNNMKTGNASTLAYRTRSGHPSRKVYVLTKFIHALDHLQRTFYGTTYATLSSISPPERKVNGISFMVSSLFLQIALIALSTEVDPATRAEIDKCTGFIATEQEKVEILNDVLSWLPVSDGDLKFRYATRLVLKSDLKVSRRFLEGAASALRMNISYLNNNDTAELLTQKLNHMVEWDSGGSMRDTFDEDELSQGLCGVLLSTLYVRARWRAPPTLLNGTVRFRDTDTAPYRTTHMIRINDVMRYVDLREWDAEVSAWSGLQLASCLFYIVTMNV